MLAAKDVTRQQNSSATIQGGHACPAALARSNDPVKRRFLQFSLRGLLVALTGLCLLGGWTIERARRRGEAIDKIVSMGGDIWYPDYEPYIYLQGSYLSGKPEHVEHFWPDLRSVPVYVKLGIYSELNAETGSGIATAVPLSELMMTCSVDDRALMHLKQLNDGCVVTIYGSEKLTDEGINDFARRFPKIKVVISGRATEFRQ